jgi:hypothetical protein
MAVNLDIRVIEGPDQVTDRDFILALSQVGKQLPLFQTAYWHEQLRKNFRQFGLSHHA